MLGVLMELATEIIVFILGVGVGIAVMFARAKYSGDNKQIEKELNACQQENAMLKQSWQDHLAEYRSLATNLKEMSAHIEGQVEDAEHLLTAQEKAPAFPFFSTEATNILKNADRKKRRDSTNDNQPLDYSGSASGLFQGAANKEIAAEKS